MNLYRCTYKEASIDRLFDQMCKDIMGAPSVDTGHWQAKTGVPQTVTRELQHVMIQVPILASKGSWAAWVRPNLPWADEHFEERVGGRPLNPPPSHVNWPFNQRGNEDFITEGAFSHSYPERLWPRFVPIESGPNVGGYGEEPHDPAQHGIRFEYGDLDNAIDLLLQEPYTRQCYIPMWFPEDLHAAAVEHERVPCSLGWHLMLREGKLHCFYPMRSVDLLRYFRDDLYMAGRLVLWAIDRCQRQSSENSLWWDVMPGDLTLFASSLHCFEGDIPGLHHRLKKEAA